MLFSGYFHDAERLISSNTTVFYHLTTQPDIGIMVVHTFGALNAEVNAILESHVAFNNRCMTKILVDSQGNGGGLIPGPDAVPKQATPRCVLRSRPVSH
ncbi:hypothetical protein K457DRAFT_143059 [Linnemannia elongata AG-77]|uniref:Tail specific protease domain-containing protein n=1 Tax=Linnemannia elongata AG-77 TaxID=1314771 RepID=A0A197JD17_9FUNG|nr:hypothetical protein K457DRAFT_143059 [Linnemannia elongata AG-77]